MVFSRTRIIFALAALFASTATPLLAKAQQGLEFVAVSRQSSESWLLERTGRVYVQRGTAAPLPQFSFRQKDGSPLRWKHSPAGIARFNGLWVIADGMNILRTFSPDGMLVAEVPLPVPVFDVFATEKRCWIYYSLGNPVDHALWSTTDLRVFTQSALEPVDPKMRGRDRVLLAHVMFGPAKGDSFYFAPFIGEPVVTKVDAGTRLTRIPAAYLRTRERAALLRPSDVSDIESYSAPTHDLFASSNGDLFVLRNREDVKAAHGIVVPQQGRRLDRYGADGRHLGTATFPVTMRWILRADKDRAWAITADGSVQSAPFGAPVRGGIVD